MARPYFKKRRGPGGPSKNEEKVARSREAAARERGLIRLGDRFPTVQRLTVQHQLLSPQNAPLSEKQAKAYGPNDTLDFSMPCPGRCGEGSFNLDAKIQALVEAREAVSETTGICQQPLYADSPDVCGTKLQCRIEIAYLPELAA